MRPLITTENENEETAIQAFNAALTHEADIVILGDCSTSMDAPIEAICKSRLAVMRDCLLRVVSRLEKAAVTLFATTPQRLIKWEAFDSQRFACGWGTDLARALRSAAKLNPSQIVVITDGEPNHIDAALDQARTMLCKIDVYYCGPGHARAVQFCRDLAQYGGECVIDPSCVTMLESVSLFLTDRAIAA